MTGKGKKIKEKNPSAFAGESAGGKVYE